MTDGVDVEEAKRLSKMASSCVREVEGEVTVLVHPMYASKLKEGIMVELKSLAKHYSKTLGGIPMAFERVRLVSSHGWLFDLNPYTHVVVRAVFYVFAPTLGSSLEGVVKKKSVNHLGCLVHGVFNVSVPRPQGTLKEDWCGAALKEGSPVTLTITDLQMNSYIPFIMAKLDPDRMKESEEGGGKKTTLDDDSGISSNDHDDPQEPQGKKKKKKKLAHNTDGAGEGKSDATPKAKKKGKKNGAGESANDSLVDTLTATPKSKKKNIANEMEDSGAVHDISMDEPDVATPKSSKKKNKKRNDISECQTPQTSTTSNSDLLQESLAVTPTSSKKKKKKGKNGENEAMDNSLLMNASTSGADIDDNETKNTDGSCSLNDSATTTPKSKKKKKKEAETPCATHTSKEGKKKQEVFIQTKSSEETPKSKQKKSKKKDTPSKKDSSNVLDHLDDLPFDFPVEQVDKDQNQTPIKSKIVPGENESKSAKKSKKRKANFDELDEGRSAKRKKS